MKKSVFGLAGMFLLGATCALANPAAVASIAGSSQAGYRLLQFGGHYVKWGGQALGTGATVTYAFIDSSMQFENTRNCSSMVPMTVATKISGIPLDAWQREAAKAFRIWEEAADISFVAVDDPSQADILIGAQRRPVGRAYANVTYLPESRRDGVKVIGQALICFNPFHGWKVGFDGDTSVYDIRYTFVHEIGHAIGLSHPGPSGQVMSFRYSERHVNLQPGDLRGVTHLYGQPRGRMVALASDLSGADSAGGEGQASRTALGGRVDAAGSSSSALRHTGFTQR